MRRVVMFLLVLSMVAAAGMVGIPREGLGGGVPSNRTAGDEVSGVFVQHFGIVVVTRAGDVYVASKTSGPWTRASNVFAGTVPPR